MKIFENLFLKKIEACLTFINTFNMEFNKLQIYKKLNNQLITYNKKFTLFLHHLELVKKID